MHKYLLNHTLSDTMTKAKNTNPEEKTTQKIADAVAKENEKNEKMLKKMSRKLDSSEAKMQKRSEKAAKAREMVHQSDLEILEYEKALRESAGLPSDEPRKRKTLKEIRDGERLKREQGQEDKKTELTEEPHESKAL